MKYCSLSLILIFLVSCGETERFAAYDNEEEVNGFFETRNKEVLVSLEEKKSELTKKIAEPEEGDERDVIEKDLANNDRRMDSPEFFSYATMAELPENLSWQTGMNEPEIGSSRAKKGGIFNTYLPGLAFPPTIRSIGKNANNGFRSEHWDNIEMALVSLHPNSMETIPGLADRWAVGKDGRTVYFRINERAKWSDGRQVTVEDFFMTFYVSLSDLSLIHISEPTRPY